MWSRISEFNAVLGEGIYLYDEEVTRYIDFTSGIGVTSTGHCHPRVVEAVQPVVPESLDTFFFSNSGAEAVESAVKLAKQVTNRQNVVVFQGRFHGRFRLTVAITTSKTVYRGFYQPLVPGIFTAPFPSSYYYGWDDETTMGFVMKELDRNARERGEQLRKALTDLSKDFDCMGDVRGLGLMTAVEFSRGGEPDPQIDEGVEIFAGVPKKLQNSRSSYFPCSR